MNSCRHAAWLVVASIALCVADHGREAGAREAEPESPRIVAVRVGFDGHYKLGYWTPVEVTLAGGAEDETGVVELLLPDGDGMLTCVTTLPSRGVRMMPGRRSTALLYAKFGRSAAALTVRLVVEGRLRAERTYRPGTAADDRHTLEAMSSTDNLILALGPPTGITAALARRRDYADPKTVVADLPDVARLPTRWYGYEGVDTLVLATSRPEPFRQLGRDRARTEALHQWVRLGGRLVMFVAAEAAEVLAPSSALAALAPGRFDRMIPRPPPRALETYCGSSAPIELPAGMVRLEVPRIRDVGGRIEAYEGNRPDDLPLVIRAPLAFGEVVLVLVDPDRPPLKQWKGRGDFLRKVLARAQRAGPVGRRRGGQASTLGYTDLSGQLRDALEQFTPIRAVPFSIVAGLVLVYILLIGPLDYWVVKKWLKRMELTWITFPAWVLLLSVGAYALACWLKGDQLRINQAELVDMDVDSGLVRGTAWMHLFSPRPDAYNFSFQSALPVALEPRETRVLLSWMGLPGSWLGGMRNRGAGPALFTRPYRFAPELGGLESVPIQVWSTKSFIARWTSHTQLPLKCKLTENADGMLTGQILNSLAVDLADCYLLYDRWAYSIPALPRGRKQAVGAALEPRYLRTWLQDGGPYQASSIRVPGVLRMMMFHAAAGGAEYTQLSNRYQNFVDLSDLLRIGRAILVARGRRPGSQLLRDGQAMAGPHDQQWVVYRFVIPVQYEHRGDQG